MPRKVYKPPRATIRKRVLTPTEASTRSPYDATWRRLRLAVLTENPWCVRCGALARDVDHIVPLRIRPDLRLDRTNLQPLCVPCHKQVKQKEDNARYGE